MSDDHANKARRFEDVALPWLDDAYNLARWLMRDAQDAEDAVQDAFLRAYRSLSGFRGDNPRAWILAIVRNACYAALAARRRQPVEDRSISVEAAEETMALCDYDQLDPEAALMRKRDDEDLRRMIEALPVAFREALVLREMEDLSYREIADVTATPIGTVMSRLARARRLLQRAWARHEGKDESE